MDIRIIFEWLSNEWKSILPFYYYIYAPTHFYSWKKVKVHHDFLELFIVVFESLLLEEENS